jgi:hypothetical protein
MALPRVSPPRIYPSATRAPKPSVDAAGSVDAHRQAGFVLGDEIEAVLSGLNLEGDLAKAASSSKYRNHVVASQLALWSRAWLARLEALHALEWGNYASAFPLVRSAVDYQAAAAELLATAAAEWNEWLESGGIANAHDAHATEYELHPFRSAETLATHPILGPIYRAASDFAMPHFGATLAIAASDSTPDRVLVTFGDRDFHVGLAELQLGWLLQLSAAQLEAIAGSDAFPVDDQDAIARFRADVDRITARKDRCRIEEHERDNQRRYLVQNWRRSPGASAKRLLV